MNQISQNNQKHIELALNFFFLLFLDKEKAVSHASRVCRNIRGFKEEIPVSFLSKIHNYVIKIKKELPLQDDYISDWGSKKLNLAPWQSFLSIASFEEVEAVMFVHIFNFSIEQAAQAMNLEEGSVRYRLNHGLKKLGQSVEINPTKKSQFTVISNKGAL